MARFFAFLLLLVLSAPLTAFAQIDRYELGKRVARFERAWQAASSEHRAASARAMDDAVRNFFRMDPKQAASSVDRAYLAARGKTDVHPVMQFGLSCRLAVRNPLADVTEEELRLKLTKFYEPSVEVAGQVDVQLQIFAEDGQAIAVTSCRLAEIEAGFSWQVTVPEGDYRLQASFVTPTAKFAFEPVMLSRVERLAERLAALSQVSEQTSAVESWDETTKATLRDLHRRLEALHLGDVPECDFPAFKKLVFGESLQAAGRNSSEVVAAAASTADVWLTLAEEGREVPVRLRAAPRASADQQLPVLFLLHGAGGSENMFFETYGAGRAIELGLQRQWLVVAPRQGLLGLPLSVADQLNLLEKTFPLDRQRVYLLGHSMGAAQATRQAALHPDAISAVAAVGGGGLPGNAESIRSVRWFVAAGELDFGKRPARSLFDQLRAADAAAMYREYPEVEHLVIVQAALDDVFAFFDDATDHRANPATTTQ